jgi:hypothetical protein
MANSGAGKVLNTSPLNPEDTRQSIDFDADTYTLKVGRRKGWRRNGGKEKTRKEEKNIKRGNYGTWI